MCDDTAFWAFVRGVVVGGVIVWIAAWLHARME